MKIAKKLPGIAMATAAAALFLAAPMSANADEGSGLVKCSGVNACKGKTFCKNANNACKQQNSCKGTGIVPMSQAACDAVGGKGAGDVPAKK